MKDIFQMLGTSVLYHSLLTFPVFCLLAKMGPTDPGNGMVFLDVFLLFFFWCWASHATAVHNMQGYGLLASIPEFPKRIPETLMGVGRKKKVEAEPEDATPRNRRERRAQRNP
jgi:hypothetical protein